MGASLVYLNEPNTEIEHEVGSNEYLKYAAGSMQGWRLNMEDAHVANSKFNNNDNEALFGVFDGHGGREVAVFSNAHYEEILKKEFKSKDKDVREGLRVSFLNVDVEIKTPQGQNELGNLRRDKPPKKPALLNILSDEREKKEEEQTNEEMMLDSIGCTSNVIYINRD